MVRRENERTVYSSELGRLCPHCGSPSGRCRCGRRLSKNEEATAADGDGIVRVSRTRRGRGGKTVTLVTGVPVSAQALRDLTSDLKKRCGTGGAAKDGIIEIQGDQRDALVNALEERGFQVKLSGG